MATQMNRLAPVLAALAWAPVSLSGCGGPLPPSSAPATVDDPRALAIAHEYKSYGRVDDELRWAPFLCRQPLPGIARESTSKDAATHGQKLYSVFVKDHAGYPMSSQAGQVVVKESFTAQLVTDPTVVYEPQCGTDCVGADHFYPYAKKDGHVYRAGDVAGLFIMYRVDPATTAGSDDGWVYATVDAAQKVTASGRIESCASCHQQAPYGRLFGVPTSPLQ